MITVRGVMRPIDLDTTNTVLSARLAQMELQVNGKGIVDDAIHRPNFLYRLLLGFYLSRRLVIVLHWLLTFSWPRRLFAAESPSTRLKELVSLEGVRDNQLIGYGLVVGLNGTGDPQADVFLGTRALTNLLAADGRLGEPLRFTVRTPRPSW